MLKIGFIGTGNMGSAVARAVANSEQPCEIILADSALDKAQALAADIPGSRVVSNEEAASTADYLFLAVKPQVMPAVLAGISPILTERKDRFVLVTMAAGLSCETIRALSGYSGPIIRMMPNTPVSLGHGMIEYCGLDASAEELDTFSGLLGRGGITDPVDEKLIDAASAVSGCGPAFVYMFAEALADGGVSCGLPRDKANLYAAAMLRGSAEMLLRSGKHPGTLKDEVCSPGGSTIMGVRALEDAGFRGAVMDAVIAAYEKTLEMR